MRLAWSMRGGVSYEYLMNVAGGEERRLITKLAEDNLETTRKINMPYF